MAARLQHSDDEFTEAHEINVTPFIDVMLVLLIIFMVAAPLSTVDVAVDLPASTATPQPRPDKPLFLSVQKDLTLSLGDAAVKREELAAALEQATKGDKAAAHLPARRQGGGIWRADGGDEPAAHRRLSQGRAGRPGNRAAYPRGARAAIDHITAAATDRARCCWQQAIAGSRRVASPAGAARWPPSSHCTPAPASAASSCGTTPSRRSRRPPRSCWS